MDGSQDDGYTFSLDGAHFYNIERQNNSCNSAISVYDTSNFSRINIYLAEDEDINPDFIEYDKTGNLFVLGFCRGENGVFCHGFIAKFSEAQGLTDTYKLSYDDYRFYHNFKNLERSGFTDKAKQWSGFFYDGVDMTGMENQKYPLFELWEKCKANQNKEI